MHFRMPTKGSTNTDFKLEFSSQLKHTKHELGSKAWQFEDTMEKHSIRLPLLLQVRAMYSTVQTQKYMFWVQKNKHLFFFFCFKLQRHPKNTQWTVPLCQRVKQRVYYTRGIVGDRVTLDSSPTTVQVATNMAHKLCHLPVLSVSF